MSSFEQTLSTFFSSRPELCSAPSLIVALSGGRDSLSLLHWLAHSSLVQSDILAVYIDHGLRPESVKEGAHLAKMVAAWGVTVHVKQADLNAETFTENSGREARYKLLREVAEDSDGTAILTGHHAADQAETVLLHLLRGSGLNGLMGMKPESKLESFDLIRPMLEATPAMIDAYVATHQLTPLEDPSNQNTKFLRNKIRHDLLPKLAVEYNPQISQSLSRMAHILQADWEVLENDRHVRWEMCQLEIGDSWATIDFEVWRSASISFQRYALRNLYAQLHQSTQDLTFENLETTRIGLLKEKPDKKHQLSGTITAQLIVGKLVAYTQITPRLLDVPQVKVAKLDLNLATKGHINLADGLWHLLVEPIDQCKVDLAESKNNPWIAFVSVENDQELILRGREVGESFQPFGMTGKVSLKKCMIDRKIPAFLRDRWPIIADDTGLLWLPGHRLAQRAAVTVDSQKIIKFSFIQAITNS